jgi:putative transcriptional regulator
MAIKIVLDVMLAKRKMNLTELSDRVGITLSNLSILKNGKSKAIRVETLDKICEVLDCQPADILEYEKRRAAGLNELRAVCANLTGRPSWDYDAMQANKPRSGS